MITMKTNKINKQEETTMGNYTKAAEMFNRNCIAVVWDMQEGKLELVDGVASIMSEIRALYDATRENKRSMREAYKEIRNVVRWFCDEMFSIESNAKAGLFYIFAGGLPSTAPNKETAEQLIYLIMYQLKELVRVSADLEVGQMTHDERMEFGSNMAYVYETSAWWGVTETGLIDKYSDRDGFDEILNPFKEQIDF